MQTQKWVNLGVILSVGVLFLFLSRVVGFFWEVARLPLYEEWPVQPGQALSFLSAVGAGIFARGWETANRFFNEVVIELTKVTWPVRKETVASSGVVVLLVGIAALILALVDLIWGTMSRGVFSF